VEEWNTMAGLQPGDLVRVRGTDHIRRYIPQLEGMIGLVLDRVMRGPTSDISDPQECWVFVLFSGSRPKWWPARHAAISMERVEV
jgi:hypothetical protein